MPKINRRSFFSGMGAGLIGLGISMQKGVANAFSDAPKNETSKTETEKTNELRIKKYKSLGKTGTKTSDIIFGSTSFFSANVARYAYDLGVNTFDCAENYMGGKSEEYFSQALKGLRDKVFIITKHFGIRNASTPVNKQQLIEKCNASLKKLQTDYVDGVLMHALSTEEDIKLFLQNEDLRSGYEQLKKEGKIRFTGFSTHNAKLLLEEALKDEYADYVQVIMFMYNHMEGKEIESLVSALHKKGIGTIAMKTQAGGQQANLKSFINKDTNYAQAAIAWVLSNPAIDCAVTSMRSFSHVEEYVSASGRSLKREDLAMLRNYQEQVHSTYCRVSCNQCESSCPKGVAISDVMRYEMYYDNYGHEKEAMRNYALLQSNLKPLKCGNCNGYCTEACPFGIEVQKRLVRANEILS